MELTGILDDIEAGSGNVFADIGLPDAEQRLVKADLAIKIGDLIEARGLTQTEAAALLGVDQPKVSAIVRGRLRDFSVWRLMTYLNRSGQNVEVVVKPAEPGEAAVIRVG